DFENILTGLQETARIDGLAAHPHFEVKMSAGRAAGRSHASDRLAARDLLAHARAETGEMGITGHDAVAMVDFDDLAVAGALADITDLARCGGVDRLTIATRKIDAG